MGKRFEPPDVLAGKAVAAAARAEQHAGRSAELARGTQESMLRLRGEVETRASDTAAQLRHQASRIAAVEQQVKDVPALVATALEDMATRILRTYFRRFVALALGAVGLTGGANWLRTEQVNDKGVERVSAVREDTESMQRRLFREALAEGMARRDRELQAAAIEEARRKAAIDRATNQRDPDVSRQDVRSAVGSGNPIYE